MTNPAAETLIRPDIAALIHAGHSTGDIARSLRCSVSTVSTARGILGPRPPEDTFRANTQAVDGGHLRWTGLTDGGTPIIQYRKRKMTAYRVAWTMQHNREPVGVIHPYCDYPQCVEHVADRTLREQFNAICL